MAERNYMLIIITNVIDGCGIALGAIMPTVSSRYMLGFAGRMT